LFYEVTYQKDNYCSPFNYINNITITFSNNYIQFQLQLRVQFYKITNQNYKYLHSFSYNYNHFFYNKLGISDAMVLKMITILQSHTYAVDSAECADTEHAALSKF